MTCHITDSTDAIDHARKALGMEFFLAKPVHLPTEVNKSLVFIRELDTADVTDFWPDQLRQVRNVVNDAKCVHQQWDSATPTDGDVTPTTLRAVALLHLMGNFDLCGDR